MNYLKVPYVDLVAQHRELQPALLDAFQRVIGHAGFILGPEVTEFEGRFARLCEAGYAIGVDNGTSALALTLRALGIGPGDEVITAPNSFLASASCIALSGARPVFADVNEDFTLDVSRLEAAITPRTKAVIPVHLTGRPADMEPLMAIARRHALDVIEDCAQAVGARYRGKPVGSFGTAGCFSLHPLKNLSALGDGGVITTSDPVLRDRLLLARNHGLRNRDECEFWSFNCRLDTLQAAALLVKLDHLEAWTAKRREIAAQYRNELADVVKVPGEGEGDSCVYHTFVIETAERDGLQRHLLECGVETKVHYPIPIHLQPAARELGYGPGSFPVAERQAGRILSLPVYPELTGEQRAHVISSIREYFEKVAADGIR